MFVHTILFKFSISINPYKTVERMEKNDESKIMKQKCKICEKLYTTKQSLRKHFIAAHEQKGEVYNCNICDKSYQNISYLNGHVDNVHGAQKKFKRLYESCNKSFFKASQLKIHIHTVHAGHKDYKCESCGNSFTGAQYF